MLVQTRKKGMLQAQQTSGDEKINKYSTTDFNTFDKK